jgi:YggT family protein
MEPGLISIFFEVVRAILRLISTILIVYIVISWLFAFDVVSRRNQFVNTVWEFTRRLTDPMLRPLRRMIPPIAGVDLSVMVLLLALWLFGEKITYWIESVLRGGPIL